MKIKLPLILLLHLFVNYLNAQELSSTHSDVIEEGLTSSCSSAGVTRANKYYQIFDPKDYGIHSAYHINQIKFGIQLLSGASDEGYPIVVKVFSVKRGDIFFNKKGFPKKKFMKLRGRSRKMIKNQELSFESFDVNAVIPANQKIVVLISVKSDVRADGGKGKVKFFIGANSTGKKEKSSFIEAETCSIAEPETLESQGMSNAHIVVNVKGSSATAHTNELEPLGFSYYPNPIKDKLVMKADQEISNVKIYNVLGQKIKEFAPSKLKTELNFSSLQVGTYIVKATVDNKTGTFKVVKI